jgi:hypothetical protein
MGEVRGGISGRDDPSARAVGNFLMPDRGVVHSEQRKVSIRPVIVIESSSLGRSGWRPREMRQPVGPDVALSRRSGAARLVLASVTTSRRLLSLTRAGLRP